MLCTRRKVCIFKDDPFSFILYKSGCTCLFVARKVSGVLCALQLQESGTVWNFHLSNSQCVLSASVARDFECYIKVHLNRRAGEITNPCYSTNANLTAVLEGEGKVKFGTNLILPCRQKTFGGIILRVKKLVLTISAALGVPSHPFNLIQQIPIHSLTLNRFGRS